MPRPLCLTRDTARLTDKEFDVLVIGGGVHGAAIAWDLALRGLKTALIEKGDFGAETSSGCFKIVHGGLRYLQHVELHRVRESVREQKILRKIAPHLVHPMPFLVPCYGWGMRGKELLELAMYMYEFLACDRNADVGDYHELPNHSVFSREECLEIAPELKIEGLRGGVLYYDCQMSNCERLSLAVVKAAHAAGAIVANYCEAVDFVSEKIPNQGMKIAQVVAEDKLNGRRFEIKARQVVNACGPWSRNLIERIVHRDLPPKMLGEPEGVFSKGIQLVLPQMVKRYGVAVESRHHDKAAVVARGGRSFFMFPWRGYSLVGTSDTTFDKGPDDFSIGKGEIEQLVGEVREIYRSRALVPGNVSYAFGGLRAMDPKFVQSYAKGLDSDEGEAKASRADVLVDHSRYQGLPGVSKISNLLTTVGVKYTTFRSVAERVSNLVVRKLGMKPIACRTHIAPLPGGEFEDYSEFVTRQHENLSRDLSGEVISSLVVNYGTEIEEISKIFEGQKQSRDRLCESRETIKAEIIYSARNEMACTLNDLVLRRTGLGTLGSPGEEVLKEAARVAAGELGWDKPRTEEEVEKTKQAFVFS